MFEVGQKLWYVPNRHGRREQPDGYEIAISKVGRSWLTVDEHMRLAADDLHADGRGYSSPGRAWLSKQDYLDEKARNDAWDALRTLLSRHYQAPAHLSASDIQNTIAALSPRNSIINTTKD